MSFDYEVMLLPETSGAVRNNWGKLHTIEGIIWHTTEGGGWTKQDALNTRQYQVNAPGSYNFIIYDKGAILTIPFLEACGGLNPNTEYWHPERYPFLKDNLDKPCPIAGCPGAYKNPTMHHLQVSFSGRRSILDLGGPAVDRMLQVAKELQAWYEVKAGKPLLQSGHMHWQTNRSDPGKIFAALDKDSLPDTAVTQPQETRMVVVTVRPFGTSVRFSVKSGTTIVGYEPKAGAVKTVKFNSDSGARADAFHFVEQETSRAPQGKLLHVVDGVFAGLLIDPALVSLDPIPDPSESARIQGQKEGAASVKTAANAAAAKFGV